MATRRAMCIASFSCALLSSFSIGACKSAPPLTVTPIPAGAEHSVLSLQGIDCQSCGESVVGALKKTAGVYKASFERDSAEVSVDYDPMVVRPERFIVLVQDLGYQASEGAGKGAYIGAVEFPAALDVQEISEAGEDVELKDFIVPGKVTVFDFHARWCGPCKVVNRHMLTVLQENDDVALRKIDVVDWDTPVAKHYLKKVADLPYVIVYGSKGKKVTDITGLNLAKLDQAIAKGRR